jgi:anti-sigma-K factor RskA
VTSIEDLHELAGAYALDALDGDERARFEAHLRSCEQCQVDVADFQSIALALAEHNHAQPPDRLKASVLAQVAQTRQDAPELATVTRGRFGRTPSILAVAAAVALFVVGAVVFTRPDTDPTSEVVSAADAVVATLEATTDGQTGTVQVVWSDNQDQVAVIADGLADPGPGMAYALWFVHEDGVAPAGLFAPDDGSVAAVLAIDDLWTTGWGITIEPDTGSDQPTTPVLFAGSI